MSDVYGQTDDAESLATLEAALDSGVTLLDTGDFYGMGHNELLLGRVLRGRRREQVQLSVKFGALRGPDGAWIGFDARPAAAKTFLAYTLRRLGVDYIDIYRPARLDPQVPIEDTIGAIRDLVQAGYVRHIGLSEVGPETIRRAHAVHPISDLQIEYSLISRTPEAEIFPTLTELGIGITAYGVLSRGLLNGSAPRGPGDFRAHLPRFSGENAAHNQALVARLQFLAAQRGITAGQLAIAWVLAQHPNLVAVVGARRRSQLSESLAALAISLSPEELASISAALPAAAGNRYDAHQMRALDSERTES
jgi:aryl-alcohol dehydrogenase-like predicted oxidoreductase